jgi:hypothetical protein
LNIFFQSKKILFLRKQSWFFYTLKSRVRFLYATYYNLICKNKCYFLGQVSENWLNQIGFLSQLKDTWLNKKGILSQLIFSWLNKELKEFHLYFYKSVDNKTVLLKLNLFTKLPPHVLLSQAAMLTDLKTFL